MPLTRSIRTTTCASALAVLVAGCQATGPGSASPSRDAPATADAPPARPSAGTPPRELPPDTVILGEATYRERIKAPPGASLVVELVAMAPSPRVVARVSKPDVAGPPIGFALPYDDRRVDAGVAHGLRAELVGPDGERWFATSAPVPVVPGSGMAVELVMRRSPGPSTARPVASLPASHWECGDLGVMARTDPSSKGTRLDANGATWRTGTDGVRFDAKDGGARLRLPGQAELDCVPARQPSPWNEAALRGLGFRAVGNEPGWYVEVDRGDPASMRVLLDHGERRLVVESARRGAEGYRGAVAGEDVVLDIRPVPCTDGMSGQRFDATATLRVGRRTYSGCGAFLDD